MTEGKEVTTKNGKDSALAVLENAANEIDAIIEASLPMTTKAAASFSESLAIASGIGKLRKLMLNTPEIERVVMHMANNRLGFMTDRSPATLASNRRRGKGVTTPYTYEALVDAVVEGLLKGYRISGNEMNIIAGNFYAAKAGSFRLIIEWPGMANFKYGNQPVVWGQGQNAYAQVKCWATWQLNAVDSSIGIEKDDDCTLQIRVNAMMGEDAVIGKAHSKLFKRVLERISGQVMPESTEIGPGDYLDADVQTDTVAIEDKTIPSLDKLRSNDTDLYKTATKAPEPSGLPPVVDHEAMRAEMRRQRSGATSHPPDGYTMTGKKKEELPNQLVAKQVVEWLNRDFAPMGAQALGYVYLYAEDTETDFSTLLHECVSFPERYTELKHYITEKVKPAKSPEEDDHLDGEAEDAAIAKDMEDLSSKKKPEIIKTDKTEPKEAKKEEKIPKNDKPEKKNSEGTWWHTVSNWINKRGSGWLLALRIGMGLPFREQIVMKGEEEFKLDNKALYDMQLKNHPESFDTLMDSHKVVIDKAKDKLTGIGFSEELWDLWLLERDGAPTETGPQEEKTAEVEEKKAETRPVQKYNGVQVSLPFDASPDVKKRWDGCVHSNPEAVAKYVSHFSMPTDDEQALAVLTPLETTIKENKF